MNLIVQSGNLTRDCEVRYTAGGDQVTTFSLAVNNGWGDKKKTHFLEVVVFGKRGETIAKFLKKGSSAIVTGRLDEQKWESDGVKKSKFQIIATDVEFGSKKSEGGSSTDDFTPPPDEKSDLEPF